MRIDALHEKASARWPGHRWNIIIIRNVGKGETGPGKVSKIEYIGEKPTTIIAEDLDGFALRSILPGESYAKLFAVQDRNSEKEDTPRVQFTYECENSPVSLSYPPVGKEDLFLDVYPEHLVRVVGLPSKEELADRVPPRGIGK